MEKSVLQEDRFDELAVITMSSSFCRSLHSVRLRSHCVRALADFGRDDRIVLQISPLVPRSLL